VTVAVFGLTRETLLDLTVNAIPLGILLFLDVLFWFVNPFGWDLWYVFWMHVLTLFPFTVLFVVTYVSGRVVQRDEGELADSEH